MCNKMKKKTTIGRVIRDIKRQTPKWYNAEENKDYVGIVKRQTLISRKLQNLNYLYYYLFLSTQ